jgi:hypothetical protein
MIINFVVNSFEEDEKGVNHINGRTIMIDNIEKIKHSVLGTHINLNKFEGFDEIYCHNCSNKDKKIDYEINETVALVNKKFSNYEISFKEFWLWDREGKLRTLLTNAEVYIMNDEGKTLYKIRA